MAAATHVLAINPSHLVVLDPGYDALPDRPIPERAELIAEPGADRNLETDLAVQNCLPRNTPTMRERPDHDLADARKGSLTWRKSEDRLDQVVIEEGNPCLDRGAHRGAVRPHHQVLRNPRAEIEGAEVDHPAAGGPGKPHDGLLRGPGKQVGELGATQKGGSTHEGSTANQVFLRPRPVLSLKKVRACHRIDGGPPQSGRSQKTMQAVQPDEFVIGSIAAEELIRSLAGQQHDVAVFARHPTDREEWEARRVRDEIVVQLHPGGKCAEEFVRRGLVFEVPRLEALTHATCKGRLIVARPREYR